MPRKHRNFQRSNNVIIGESFKIAIEVAIKKFISTEDLKEWEFPSSFTAPERAFVHSEVHYNGLKSKSRGKGSARYLTMYKREGSAIMQRDATMSLTKASRSLLMNLLSRYPVTTKERQDCLPPIERCKDVYQDGKDNTRALGRVSIGTPQVPLPANKPISQSRMSLPVYSLMDTIVKTINDNQVTIIGGHTGCGKTTQVPQYLLDWHEREGKPCMILCSQPRRLSAVSVSERVAAERGEKIGQSIGYQIRLEGKSSPYYTVLLYCTSGVLLRSLMAGEGMMGSVTHIIIDEVHERDRLSDFTLIVLKEALTKFRSLRLILMSATLDAKQFCSYFNNCPFIPVPGKQFDVKEYFLEDILKQTGYVNSEMEKLKVALNKRKAQQVELVKWTAAVTHGNVTPEHLNIIKEQKEVGSSSEMDNALWEAWACGSESHFAQILYLIQSEMINIDYQHSETGVTALMTAAARGSLETVESLLGLGASVNIRSSNNFTALDWAQLLSQQEISDSLEAYALNFEQNTTVLTDCERGNASSKRLSEADLDLLELYNNATNNSVIDYNLITALISTIHQDTSNKGGILVFLPGYAEISDLKEFIVAESNKLNQKLKIILLILHSNMQTYDQKLVFRPTPPNSRKVILSTNIAETSLTIEDISFVIDTGKMKEKSYNALTGASQLSTIWISKSSALQRKGRAGRVQAGVCYRLFSSVRYETMNRSPTPEILRTPLFELCLFAKQLAPPNTSIVDFLSRAIDPPSSLASRSAVALLKTIDALDTWEDLTDLGHHLVDFPIDPRYGKMLIYAVVLKCLDPVLTIVCCLSYRDVFTLPEANSDKRRTCVIDRIKFANGSLSDHMVLLKVFQGWQEARKIGREKQFCIQNCVSGANMEMIMGTRAQVLTQLRASGFIRAKAPMDIKYVNTNSDNWAVVKAAIVGGLYPNIGRVDREHNVIRTVKEHSVRLHATSILNKGRYSNKTNIEKLPSDWIMYEELTKVGQLSLIRIATVISPITVTIFAGPAKIPFDALSDSTQDSAGSDSEEEDVGPNQTATLKVDDWATFRTDSDTAQLALQLRVKWHSLLSKKLRLNKILNYMEEMVINTIVKVLSAEEQVLGLTQPPGTGKRPYLTMPETLSSARMDYGDNCNIDANILGLEMSNRNRNCNTSSPSKSNFERFNGTPKMYEEMPSPTPSIDSSIEMIRSNCASPHRYFVVRAGQMKNVELSFVHKMWAFLPLTQNRIVQAYKGGKNVILVFSIQGTNHFQGYARLTGDTLISPELILPELISGHMFNRPLPIEWIKKANVPHHATRHIFNPYNEYAKVHLSRDGQEIEPGVGEMLCQLFEGPNWSNNAHFPRGPRLTRPAPYCNFKM